MAAKLTKRAVNYRRALPLARRRCGTCVMFRERHAPHRDAHGSCTLVEGMIRRNDVCDRWAGK